MSRLFRSTRSAKKRSSTDLNKVEFEFCNIPDEMTEPMDTSNHQTEVTTSDDTITDRQQQQPSTSNHHHHHHSHLFSQIKTRITAHRNEHHKRDQNDNEKNNGFVYVDNIANDSLLISSDNIQHEPAYHFQSCEHEQIDDDTVDIDYNQLDLSTPITPTTPSTINHSNNESEILATRASIECGGANFNENTIPDTQVSTTNSSTSTSTNSSNNDHCFNDIDRTIFNDNEYIIEQKRDLDRITIYEINLNNDRRDCLQELAQNENDQIDFNRRLIDVRQFNLKLNDEFKNLQEENCRIHSKWSCELCTYLNESYSITGKDVCDMCEGPSPLKRHTLIS